MATNPVVKSFLYSARIAHKEVNLLSGGKYRITPKQHSDIIKAFIAIIKKKMFDEAFIWHLPFGMGAFLIKSMKARKNQIRFHYREEGEYKFRNEHTFGKYFKIVYDKTYMTSKNKSYVLFKPAASFKRQMSEEIFRRSEDPLEKDFIAH